MRLSRSCRYDIAFCLLTIDLSRLDYVAKRVIIGCAMTCMQVGGDTLDITSVVRHGAGGKLMVLDDVRLMSRVHRVARRAVAQLGL